MVHEGNDNLVRLHEQRMAGTEAWCDKLEKKVDKIPWILFVVVVNVGLTLITILMKWK